MTDPHATDVLALLDRLTGLERECGRLRAQLEFHLRLQVAEVPATPSTPRLVRLPRAARPARGALERLIVSELAKCDALKAREIAVQVDASDEAVRSCLARLMQQAKVQRLERGRYGLAQTEVAQ